MGQSCLVTTMGVTVVYRNNAIPSTTTTRNHFSKNMLIENLKFIVALFLK